MLLDLNKFLNKPLNQFLGTNLLEVDKFLCSTNLEVWKPWLLQWVLKQREMWFCMATSWGFLFLPFWENEESKMGEQGNVHALGMLLIRAVLFPYESDTRTE